MQKVIYPGTFDPLTLGHLDIIKRASLIFKEVIILVADNPNKIALFSLDERINLINSALQEAKIKNAHVAYTSGLVVDYCRINNIKVMLRGLRNINDYENEYARFFFNKNIASDIETIIMFPTSRNHFISSSAIKELASQNVDINIYLPKLVAKEVKNKFKK